MDLFAAGDVSARSRRGIRFGVNADPLAPWSPGGGCGRGGCGSGDGGCGCGGGCQGASEGRPAAHRSTPDAAWILGVHPAFEAAGEPRSDGIPAITASDPNCECGPFKVELPLQPVWERRPEIFGGDVPCRGATPAELESRCCRQAPCWPADHGMPVPLREEDYSNLEWAYQSESGLGDTLNEAINCGLEYLRRNWQFVHWALCNSGYQGPNWGLVGGGGYPLATCIWEKINARAGLLDTYKAPLFRAGMAAGDSHAHSDRGGVTIVKDHFFWKYVEAAFDSGCPGTRDCACMLVSSQLLHELLHVCGGVEFRDYTQLTEEGLPPGDCYLSHTVSNTYLYALMMTYQIHHAGDFADDCCRAVAARYDLLGVGNLAPLGAIELVDASCVNCTRVTIPGGGRR